MALVKYDISSSQIATLTLNDPQNLNAMGEEMAHEFAGLTTTLRNARPRVILITGEGRAFSAGGKLDMLEKKKSIPPEENRKLMLSFYHSFLAVRALNIPLIALINGHAIGAGMCLACACDMRIAALGAKLGFTFSKLGLHPGMGATYFLPKLIGIAAATELLVTGRVVDANEALRIGLISKVCAAEDLHEKGEEMANEILQTGRQTTSLLLETLRGNPADLESALEFNP
jgi:enoyl-CoA hydratase/carnithine racemase